MLATIVKNSIENRRIFLILLGVLLAGGLVAARLLPIDAVPDVSTIQVAVLTEAPGLSSEEVEQMVTFPLETTLNGIPGLIELRSVSRSGLSAITIVFREGTDVWFARQLVVERLRQAEGSLPPVVQTPQLAPVTTGLGEIYQFVVRSSHHSPMQLRTILDWEIVPQLRSVTGVIDVNTMGGELKQYQVVLDQSRLHTHKLTLGDLQEALQKANSSIGGGYLERDAEALSLRGIGLLRNEDDIRNVIVANDADGTPILVRHVAHVRIGSALRYGVITRDGKEEAVTGVVMMLLGSNSRTVLQAVHKRIAEVKKSLPPGVSIDTVYDRSDFVGRTLATVMRNLLEGAVIVTIILAIFLGSLRGAIAVVIGIPASMSIALFGMHLFDVTGDLMSLGAIDFGFLVDGPIVILEAVLAMITGHHVSKEGDLSKTYADAIMSVIKPVAYSVAIIMLVYLPLFTLRGIEGKMFRPMATTMAFALLGALIYAIVFFPALVVTLVKPASQHRGTWFTQLTNGYRRILPYALQHRIALLVGASIITLVAFVMLIRGGADFVPRIDEGDIVVTIRRAPSINLEQAKQLDLATERVLAQFPEVITTLGMTGRAELAYDPVGNDTTDIFVHLRPKRTWTSGKDLDSLATVLKNAIETQVAGTFVSISQPIEDRTNEMISGSRADVQVQLYGEELITLKSLSEQVGKIIRTVPGTGDVRIERSLGLPMISATVDRVRMAQYGVRAEDALATLQAARVGTPVGQIFEGQKRFDLRLLMPPAAPTPAAMGDFFVEAAGDRLIPLSEVTQITESEGPAQIRRENLSRTVRVDVNLRGRDLVSWVKEAQEKVDASVQMPSGYRLTWGGQFENFERAKQRLGLVVPLSLAIIFAMLTAMFRNVRYASAVFMIVPLAFTGGILGLFLRQLSFSIPAAVGFIALAGISVLNGVVIASEVQRQRAQSQCTWDEAIIHASCHCLRAVLTTAAVAAVGFLPMAISTGAGAEVQRPLATVVIFGIIGATCMTLMLLPGILRIALQPSEP